MTNSRKKILFVCSDNFPKYGANGKMLNNIFCHGLKDRYEIHVLTHKFDLNDLDDEVIAAVHVHRFFSWFMFPKEKLKSLLKTGRPSVYLNLLAKKIIPKVKAKYDPGFFISKDYSDELYESIKRLDEEYSFDVIVPNLIGYENADATVRYKKNHPDSVVILYQLDPCGDNLLEKPGSAEKRLRFEQFFLEGTDAVITTPIIKRRYQRVFESKFSDKTTAMEFPAVEHVAQNYSYDENRIVCLFTGNIYKKIRDPRYTLKVFKALNGSGIELHILGKCDEKIEEELMSGNIIFHGSVPSEKVTVYTRNANILVNIGNSMTNQVPSKIVEYISTGKPIINIHKNADCPTLPYFEKYEYICNVLEKDDLDERDVETVKEFILANYNKYENNERIVEDYKECTASYCASVFEKIIESLIEKHQNETAI